MHPHHHDQENIYIANYHNELYPRHHHNQYMPLSSKYSFIRPSPSIFIQLFSASACQYIAEDSRANILVVGDLEQLAKVNRDDADDYNDDDGDGYGGDGDDSQAKILGVNTAVTY